MADFNHPTRPDWEMLDPLVHTPPLGRDLLVITEGCVLTKGPWRPGYLAWSEKPRIPQSVKDRLDAELLSKMHK